MELLETESASIKKQAQIIKGEGGHDTSAAVLLATRDLMIKGYTEQHRSNMHAVHQQPLLLM